MNTLYLTALICVGPLVYYLITSIRALKWHVNKLTARLDEADTHLATMATIVKDTSSRLTESMVATSDVLHTISSALDRLVEEVNNIRTLTRGDDPGMFS